MKGSDPRRYPSGSSKCISKGKEGIPETNLRLLVGYITVEPVYITTRNSKSTKLMKQQHMRDKIKCTDKIEINCISLMLRAY
jgi:hypothetical protein